MKSNIKTGSMTYSGAKLAIADFDLHDALLVSGIFLVEFRVLV